jgi:hypothetical protein
MAIPLAAYLIGGGLMGASWFKDVLQMIQQGNLGEKQLSLQELMAKNEAEGTKRANEENRRMAQQYLAMARETEGRRERTSSKDRQMQLLMAMLQGMGQYRQQGTQMITDLQSSAPPMSLTRLMRGM